MDKPDKQAAAMDDRRPWERPTVKRVGTIGAILQMGGAKRSPNVDDPGDATGKPPGQG
jgi:hypothetical protein